MKFAERLAALEKIVMPQKFEQYEAIVTRKIEKMTATVADFKTLLEKGEKWAAVAEKFDNIMNNFNDHMAEQLDVANEQITKAYDYAHDIKQELTKIQGEVTALRIDSLLDRTEAKLLNRMHDIKDTIDKTIRNIEDKMNEMDSTISNLAITSREHSQSLEFTATRGDSLLDVRELKLLKHVDDVKKEMTNNMRDLQSRSKLIDTKLTNLAIVQADDMTSRGRSITSRERSQSVHEQTRRLHQASHLLRSQQIPFVEEATLHQPAHPPLANVMQRIVSQSDGILGD